MLFHLDNRKRSYSFWLLISIIAAIAVVFVVVVYPMVKKPAVMVGAIGTRFMYSHDANAPVHIVSHTRGGSPNEWYVRSDKPLSVGTALYNSHQELIARVVEPVGDKLYRARLISFPEQEIFVRVAMGDSQELVHAIGRGDGVFLVELPLDAVVNVGSIAKSSEGDLIGVVAAVKLERQAPYQRVFVSPTISITATDGLYL